jgi:rare lipoprotein A
LKLLSIVFFALAIGGLVGFSVINKESNDAVERLLVEEFVPVTVKENTVNTSFVEYLNRGTMKASWYGPKFHGRVTANGEVYDQMAFTAAHKSLRFGTLLKLTNKKNGKSVIVRINDRGPYIPGRQLDVSKAVAMELGMIQKGVARLEVEEIKLGTDSKPNVFVN